MTKSVWHPSHSDSTDLIEHFWIAFSRHRRPFQALNCPIGAHRAYTPHKDHILRVSEAHLKIDFSRSEKVSVGADRRSLHFGPCSTVICVTGLDLSHQVGVPMVPCGCWGRPELSTQHGEGGRGPALGGPLSHVFAVSRPDDVTDGLTRAQTIIYNCYDV